MKRQLPLLLCTLVLSGLMSACHGGFKQGTPGYYNKKAAKEKKERSKAEVSRHRYQHSHHRAFNL